MYKKSSPESIQTLFASIAKNYDKANNIMSLGMHKKWNKALVKEVSRHQPQNLLDLCAGTGEISLLFLENNPKASATMLDFCSDMLEIAKIKGSHFKKRFNTVVADAQEVPLQTASFDAITIAYGIRNVKDPEKCFKEAYRLLRPEGIFSILELTCPNNLFLKTGHALYLKTLLPIMGKCVARNKLAYDYLAQSIKNFSSPHTLENLLCKSGFSKVEKKPLMGGVVTIITAIA